jgi:hypothetical protein
MLMPFDMIVQCNFGPNETLHELYTFVQHAVLQPKFAQSFTLFTTPPKQILSAMDATFWQMGFVPGAYVHVSIDRDVATDGVVTEQFSKMELCAQFVRNDVIARKVSVAPCLPKSEQKSNNANVGQGLRKTGGDFLASPSTKVAASGTKTPKWLKLKK